MKKISVLLVVILLLTGCSTTSNSTTISDTSNSQPQSLDEEKVSPTTTLSQFADVRGGPATNSTNLILESDKYNTKDMYTYEFNEHTVFTGNEALQQTIMENGKNPGLGIRALHEQGITGKGVSVAIIDQPLILEPPEYADRIVEYYECGYEFEEGEEGSMHGPAVTSILAGKTTGVAPGVNIYYAAAPSWNGDTAYFADGLNWIIDKNKVLTQNEKIRLVSVSGAPSGVDSPFDKNQELWDEAVERAQEAGILVMDCRNGVDTGFIAQGYYDYDDPDNIKKARSGSPRYEQGETLEGYISVPCNFRTTIEQYEKGDYYFRYGGSGGLSWSIPYAAGVLSLGWQLNPNLTAKEMKQLLMESAYENKYGERIIYPQAFIEMVKKTI